VKVALWVYESAAFGCYMSLADDVLGTSERRAMPALEGKNGQESQCNGLSEGCWGGRKGLSEFSVLLV